MQEIEGRRPLKVRGVKIMNDIAVWLTKKNITPNQISVASVFFALLAAICFLYIPHAVDSGKFILPLLAALFIQCRLLCNLFDGMVAVEGGKSTPAGELFNDMPDRIADPLILVAAGYVSTITWASSVGWLAGLLAVGTAYTRTLGTAVGAPTDFQGPMAKQHRMAVITIACVLTSIEYLFMVQGNILLLALVLICLGCVITIYRRITKSYLFLEGKRE